MFLYIPLEQTHYSPDIGEYHAWGISAFEGSQLLISVLDISTDKSFVTNIANQCTSEQLSPLHLRDVIENSLGIC